MLQAEEVNLLEEKRKLEEKEQEKRGRNDQEAQVPLEEELAQEVSMLQAEEVNLLEEKRRLEEKERQE